MEHIGETLQQWQSEQTTLQVVSQQPSTPTGIDMLNQSIAQLPDEQQNFFIKYSPDNQARYVGTLEKRMFTGFAPNLHNISIQYGRGIVVSWLMAQLYNLNEYAGTQNKMSDNQIKDLANVICNEFEFYKTTELMWFFYKFKAGYFGEFYGSVDPLKIMTSMQKFSSIRNDKRNAYDAELEKEEELKRKESEGPTMTREEYEQWKRENPDEYTKAMDELERNGGKR